ncbi:hypothetical protein VOLCADRAFT_106982 [Volvox carteri f. nagariensis]|uniref:Right handed beta helix domain-containing protein n=1 Tax=Volvox carteri f. nagariensis TaxID=3068 RepID=D8UB49_VOLCA|nr:uncharacterized protein VOLCADRAFT_106982 [Volvox carteri f. nagariensis]EFJ43111.1 hypothetical protein VOLCADRAFT_106982 [Volvox carteri f. nagariensis]|eukprot:XP_002955910.1 hypothetical protein VOLCADRAFT_106982 [Volvox carteri f. nagariensis]
MPAQEFATFSDKSCNITGLRGLISKGKASAVVCVTNINIPCVRASIMGSGNVSLTPAKSMLADRIRLVQGENVTFTRVVFTNYDFSVAVPLSISKCQGCRLQNVIFDSVVFSGNVEGGSTLVIEDSDMTMEDAAFSGLGWEDAAGGSVAQVIRIHRSNLTMYNTTIRNVKLKQGVAATVTLDNSALLVREGSSWQNVTADSDNGFILAASNSSVMTLAGCSMSEITSAAALFYVASGASISVESSNSLFVESIASRAILLASGVVGSVSFPDAQVLKAGNPTGPNKELSLEKAWDLDAVVLSGGYTGSSPLKLGRLGVTVRGNSKASFEGYSLLRLSVLENSTAALQNMSFDGQSGARQRSALQFINSFGSLSNCYFRSISLLESEVPAAATVLHVANSTVNVANCEFFNISWGTNGTQGNITTGREVNSVVNVASRGILRVTGTSFRAIDGRGSALRAVDGSILDMIGVIITDTNVSESSHRHNAAVMVLAGSSLIARYSAWSNISSNPNIPSNGAAIFASSTGGIALAGCNFTEITNLAAPVAHFLDQAGEVSIIGCIWRNVGKVSGVLWFQNLAGNLTINRSQFSECSSWSGDYSGRGIVGLSDCSAAGGSGGKMPNVRISEVGFYNNIAFAGGGLMVSRCSVYVTNSSFTGNVATSPLLGGGAAYIQAGSMNFTFSQFTSNSASGFGGALYTSTGANLSCSGCTFSLNTVGSEQAGSAQLGNSQANGSGGAIFADSSNLYLDTCEFALNTVQQGPGGGGAIAVRNASLLSISTTVSFIGNNALVGGAISSRDSTLNLIFTSFFNNSAAERYGGAVFASRSRLTLLYCVLTGNSAKQGGALCVDCDSQGNNSQQEGAVLRRIPFDTTMAPTNATYLMLSSKLLDVFNSSPTRIDRCTFTQNTCKGGASDDSAGGAMLANGPVFIQASQFIGNSCPRGGAVAFGSGQQLIGTSSDWVAVTLSSFRFNRADTRGGAEQVAVRLRQVNLVLLKMCVTICFSLESAGVEARMGWALDLLENNFTANGNSNSSLVGGAVYLEQCANLQTDVAGYPNVASVRNNFVENFGDSFLLAPYDPPFACCLLSSHCISFFDICFCPAGSSLQHPPPVPGVYMMRGVYAESNYAGGSGGALLVSGNRVNILDSVFVNNSAEGAGGALMVSQSSPSSALRVLQRDATEPSYSTAEYEFFRTSIVDITFTGNSAITGGGAIYSETSRMLVEDSTFDSNTVGDGITTDVCCEKFAKS